VPIVRLKKTIGSCVVLTALLLATSAGAAGQDQAPRWFVGEPVAPLIADPTEVMLRAGAHWISRDLTGLEGADPEGTAAFERGEREGEVALGYRTALVSFQREAPGRPALAVGFEVGIFARFLLDTRAADLLNTDFRVGFPVQLAYSGWEARFTLTHSSYHLGDDLARRFDIELVSPEVNANRVHLLVARRPVDEVRVYAGGVLDLGSNDALEKWSVQWGAEWDRSVRADHRGTAPLIAADFRYDELTGRIAGNAIIGATFHVSETRIQLGAHGHFGPSAAGRLRTIDEEFIGFWVRFIP